MIKAKIDDNIHDDENLEDEFPNKWSESYPKDGRYVFNIGTWCQKYAFFIVLMLTGIKFPKAKKNLHTCVCISIFS